MLNVMKVCERGKRHRLAHLPKQDACRVTQNGRLLFVGVADGHGGKPYARSGLGARMALAAAEAAAGQDLAPRAFAAAVKDRFDRFIQLHLARRPPTETELEKLGGLPARYLYGTTLLGAAIDLKEEKCRVFRIGDGDLNVIDENGCFLPLFGQDEDCVSGMTSSMVYEREACLEHFYVRDLPLRPAAIILNTDGYSFKEEYPTRLASALFAEDPVDAFHAALERGKRGDDQTAVLIWQPDPVAAPAFAQGVQRYRELAALDEDKAMLVQFLKSALERSAALRSGGREADFLRLREIVSKKVERLQEVEGRIKALTALTQGAGAG